jgi:hypothetical protein
MGKSKERKFNVPREDKDLKLKKRTSKPLEYANLALKKRKMVVPTMTPKPAQTIENYRPSEEASYGGAKKSMSQLGREMSKSGPRKNLRETAAVVKGKLQNAYNKATGRKTISMEMDGKTFTGTDKMGMRRGVTKVSNPTAGSRKVVDTYTSEGNLKRQRIVDRDASGKKIQVIKRKG